MFLIFRLFWRKKPIPQILFSKRLAREAILALLNYWSTLLKGRVQKLDQVNIITTAKHDIMKTHHKNAQCLSPENF